MKLKTLTLFVLALLCCNVTLADTGITPQSAKSLAKFSVDSLRKTYQNRGDYASVAVVDQYRHKLERCFADELLNNRKTLTYGTPEQQNQVAVDINVKCAFEAAQKAREDGFLEQFTN